MERLSPQRIESILRAAPRVRVLVVGDVMLDRYVFGSVERTSPEAPVPVVLVEGERSAPGGAANVAANASALGARCDVVAMVGRDPEGERLRAHLNGIGVGTAGLIEVGDRPTTVKTRVIARHQHVVRLDRELEADADGTATRALLEAVDALVGSADVVVLQDYNKGTLAPTVIEGTLGAAARSAVVTVCDPKVRNFFAYGGATVFKPNGRELVRALNGELQPDDPAWMERVRARLGCENLLVTLGEAGLALQPRGGALLRVPTAAREVFDVSGAGDTVAAALAVALGAGAAVAEAALLANHAAAIQVGKVGVATVAPEELTEHARNLHEELMA